jgi:hypothetical protein
VRQDVGVNVSCKRLRMTPLPYWMNFMTSPTPDRPNNPPPVPDDIPADDPDDVPATPPSEPPPVPIQDPKPDGQPTGPYIA